MSRFSYQSETHDERHHYWLMYAAAALAFSILVWRLWHLQVEQGGEYLKASEENFVQTVELPATRGMIIDSRGVRLSYDRERFDVVVTPKAVRDLAALLEQLRWLLGMDDDEVARVKKRIQAIRGLARFKPVLVKRDIDRDTLGRLLDAMALHELPGVRAQVAHGREYPFDVVGSNVVGYVGEIGSTELERKKAKGLTYELGDLLGRGGIEAAYESLLRGEDGARDVVVDVHGQIKDDLVAIDREQAPKPGHNVHLSLDMDLQLAAEEAFPGLSGTLVAMEVKTGFIRALVSRPSFDPNVLAARPSKLEWDRLEKDPLRPLRNRAVQDHFAPGSTYKVITAMAAYEARATQPRETVNCPGYFSLGGSTRWRCHLDRGHGAVNIHTALQKSCDIYFYTMGYRVGMDAMADIARKFGLGAPTGLGLDNETKGIIPDAKYNEEHFGANHPGLAVNTAIGQGDVNVTPMQLAVLYAAIANGGTVWIPQIVTRVESANGEAIKVIEPKVRSVVKLRPETLEVVHKGLEMVVNDPGGTAYYRRLKDIAVAGKTGTAQVRKLEERVDQDEIPLEERDHAWFVGYAPVADPEIVVVVLNEHGQHGSSGAAPTAMAVIKRYLEIQHASAEAARQTAVAVP